MAELSALALQNVLRLREILGAMIKGAPSDPKVELIFE